LGNLSAKTQSYVATNIISETDDLYPDRQATVVASVRGTTQPFEFDKVDTDATVMRLGDEVPRVSYDMNKLFEWKHGDKVRGTHAKAHVGMKGYRKDINKAYGKESSYKHIYIDTFKPIGPQLKRLKK
jgi:hypothetical protein